MLDWHSHSVEDVCVCVSEKSPTRWPVSIIWSTQATQSGGSWYSRHRSWRWRWGHPWIYQHVFNTFVISCHSLSRRYPSFYARIWDSSDPAGDANFEILQLDAVRTCVIRRRGRDLPETDDTCRKGSSNKIEHLKKKGQTGTQARGHLSDYSCASSLSYPSGILQDLLHEVHSLVNKSMDLPYHSLAKMSCIWSLFVPEGTLFRFQPKVSEV